MAIVVSEFTSFSSLNNASAYTCMANVTPPTNGLVILGVVGSRSGGASVAPTVTGCGLTWNSYASITFNGGIKRLSLYTARGTPSAGTIHIAFAAGQSHCFVTSVKCTGESGTLIQSATTTNTGTTTIQAFLSAFSGAGNGSATFFSRTSATAVINPFDSSSVSFTPKLGEALGTGTGSDSGTLASAWTSTSWASSGATWTTAGDSAGIAVEINTAPAVGGAFPAYYTSHYYPHVVAAGAF